MSTNSIGQPGDDTEFGGVFVSAGGAGSCSVNFTALSGPIPGQAEATIGNLSNFFTGLTLSWVSTVNGLLTSTAIVPTSVTLATLFSAPGNLSQNMVISWTSSVAGAGFDYTVETWHRFRCPPPCRCSALASSAWASSAAARPPRQPDSAVRDVLFAKLGYDIVRFGSDAGPQMFGAISRE